MNRQEATACFGEDVVEYACDMYETDIGKVFFDEEGRNYYDFSLPEDEQLEYFIIHYRQ